MVVVPHVKYEELTGDAIKDLKTATDSVHDHRVRPLPGHVWAQHYGGSFLDAHR
jgi:hypothetical protein